MGKADNNSILKLGILVLIIIMLSALILELFYSWQRGEIQEKEKQIARLENEIKASESVIREKEQKILTLEISTAEQAQKIQQLKKQAAATKPTPLTEPLIDHSKEELVAQIKELQTYASGLEGIVAEQEKQINLQAETIRQLKEINESLKEEIIKHETIEVLQKNIIAGQKKKKLKSMAKAFLYGLAAGITIGVAMK